MIDPVQPALPTCTVDDKYIGEAVPSVPDVHVVTDSDDIAVIELTAAATRGRGTRDERRIDRQYRMALIMSEAGPHHRAFWQRTIRLHGGPMDSVAWRVAEEDASRFARRVEALSRWPRLAGLLVHTISLARRRAEKAHRRLRRARKRVRRAVAIARHRAGKWLRMRG